MVGLDDQLLNIAPLFDPDWFAEVSLQFLSLHVIFYFSVKFTSLLFCFDSMSLCSH